MPTNKSFHKRRNSWGEWHFVEIVVSLVWKEMKMEGKYPTQLRVSWKKKLQTNIIRVTRDEKHYLLRFRCYWSEYSVTQSIFISRKDNSCVFQLDYLKIWIRTSLFIFVSICFISIFPRFTVITLNKISEVDFEEVLVYNRIPTDSSNYRILK